MTRIAFGHVWTTTPCPNENRSVQGVEPDCLYGRKILCVKPIGKYKYKIFSVAALNISKRVQMSKLAVARVIAVQPI